MKIQFEVKLSEDQVKHLADELGLLDEESVAEWMAEVYFWGAKDHFDAMGFSPMIDTVASDNKGETL